MADQRPATALSVSIIVLLALLVGLDFVLIAVHIAKPYFPALRPHHFSLEADRGVAEWFQYAKQAAIVALMLVCWLRRESRIFFVWSGLFAFLLLDDAYSLHEQAGEALAASLSLSPWFGLRPQDVGELLFAALVGVASLAALGAALIKERGTALHDSLRLVILLSALTFCGVVVDAIHVIAYFSGSRFAWVLTIVEDGGELIVTSVITAYAYWLAERAGHAERASLPVVAAPTPELAAERG
jgi:hypothetical protein